VHRPATTPTTARWSDALVNSDNRARGVAFWASEIRRELKALDRAGVKGVALQLHQALVDSTPRT